MRGGKLLAQDNPDILINKYSSHSLEDVFLKLCQINDTAVTQGVEAYSQDCNKDSQIPFDALAYSEKTSEKAHKKLHNSRNFSYFFSWFRVYAVFMKTWNKIKGNPILFLAYLLPSVQLSIFCFSVGKDPRALNIAIHNDESPPLLTQHFLHFLNNDTIIQV